MNAVEKPFMTNERLSSVQGYPTKTKVMKDHRSSFHNLIMFHLDDTYGIYSLQSYCDNIVDVRVLW